MREDLERERVVRAIATAEEKLERARVEPDLAEAARLLMEAMQALNEVEHGPAGVN